MEFKAADGCCEEASIFSQEKYIPCNAPASKVMWCDKDRRCYRMCEPCAYHNVKRGMVDVTSIAPEDMPESFVNFLTKTKTENTQKAHRDMVNDQMRKVAPPVLDVREIMRPKSIDELIGPTLETMAGDWNGEDETDFRAWFQDNGDTTLFPAIKSPNAPRHFSVEEMYANFSARFRFENPLLTHGPSYDTIEVVMPREEK